MAQIYKLMRKVNFVISIIISVVLISMYSCSVFSPELIIDFKEQSFRTCCGQPLKSIIISCSSAPKSYFAINPNYKPKGSDKIFLDSISPNYDVIFNLDSIVTSGQLKFLPSQVYRINHSGGDVTSFNVYILTDERGRMLKEVSRFRPLNNKK